VPKRYWWVIITYVLMQLSGIIAVPSLMLSGLTENQTITLWTTISFLTALVITLALLREDMSTQNLSPRRASVDQSVLWAFLGIFIAFGAQALAGMIERDILGIDPGSENTQTIAKLTMVTPYFIIVPAVFGPVLEEVVFRKIIFGSFYKKFNFFVSAILSSLIFGLAHFEVTHLLVYTAMGFTFAFLYVKTKRIIVPIVAHVAMNSFVLLMQFLFAEDIQKYMEQFEQMEQFIGGF
jgi:membrane protease YdiL (CAAX protease family)